jgi:hypothetical protein
MQLLLKLLVGWEVLVVLEKCTLRTYREKNENIIMLQSSEIFQSIILLYVK